MAPKASPSFPPTKKRRWTPLHHLSRGSALAAVVEAASVAALATASRTAASAKAAGRFGPIVLASIIASSSRSPPNWGLLPTLLPARRRRCSCPALEVRGFLRHVGHVARAAAAFLEKRERPDLAGHFQGVAINRIVPPFDVDCSLEAAEAQFADDPRPVAVSETGGVHLHERHLAEHAVLADHVPAHGRVLCRHRRRSPCYNRQSFTEPRQRCRQRR